eukprot:8460730-Pyramimonas_sp.AAC.1
MWHYQALKVAWNPHLSTSTTSSAAQLNMTNVSALRLINGYMPNATWHLYRDDYESIANDDEQHLNGHSHLMCGHSFLWTAAKIRRITAGM